MKTLVLIIALLIASYGRGQSTGKVVIVGAGISGLAAADDLINEYGFKDVTILEALNRFGGRINTLPYGTGVLALGAEWVHGERNPIYALAKELRALGSQSRARRFDGDVKHLFSNIGVEVTGSLKTKLFDMMESLEDTVSDMAEKNSTSSIGQLYQNAYQNFVNRKLRQGDPNRPHYDAMFAYIKKSIEAENCASDWNRLSARQYSEYSDIVGESDIELGPMGYKPIVDYFVNRIQASTIKLGMTVQSISYSNNAPVTVQLSNGEIMTADHVIVTSSLGYLKQRAQQMFNPTLPPNMMNTINLLGFDTVDKLFLIYDKKFWNANTESLNFLRIEQQGESQLSQMIWGIEPKPFVENVLMAFISGTDPEPMENSDYNTISEAVTNVFRKFFNNPNIPKPKQIIRSAWKSDPMFLGSYSTYTIECGNSCSRRTLQQPIPVYRNGKMIPAILLAGEATSEHEFQTVHGALASGRKAASIINDSY